MNPDDEFSVTPKPPAADLSKWCSIFVTHYLRRIMARRNPPYGFFKFLADVFMTVLTAGFWLIWVFIREINYR